MALALPSSLTAFPPPISPDIAYCGDFIPHTVHHDCWAAFDRLFEGDKVVPWYTDSKRGYPFALPLNKTFGACNILVQASGKAAEEENFAIHVSPNDIRDMVGHVIQQCIRKGKADGVTTRFIDRTINWLVAPEISFPKSLNLPQSLTFLTALVQTLDHLPTPDWEPGAQDSTISDVFLQAIEGAVDALPRASPLQRDLEARHAYILAAQEHQRYSRFMPGPYGTWWDDAEEEEEGVGGGKVVQGLKSLFNHTTEIVNASLGRHGSSS